MHHYRCKPIQSALLHQNAQLTFQIQVLFGTGDIIAQQLVERKGLDNHDMMRTARMGGYGGSTSPLPLPFPSAPALLPLTTI